MPCQGCGGATQGSVPPMVDDYSGGGGGSAAAFLSEPAPPAPATPAGPVSPWDAFYKWLWSLNPWWLIVLVFVVGYTTGKGVSK